MALLPFPAASHALAAWKQATLHLGCHVVFDPGFYSAPHRLIEQKLRVRAAELSMRNFHQQIKHHERGTLIVTSNAAFTDDRCWGNAPHTGSTGPLGLWSSRDDNTGEW